MQPLPFIDEHEVAIAADLETAWRALVGESERVLGGPEPGWFGRFLRVSPAAATGRWSPDPEVGSARPGFEVVDVQRPSLISLRGQHRFSRYRLDFELSAAGTDRSILRARSWAEFPGVAGSVYRAVVIGSGGHGVIVRRMLRRIAAAGRS